MNNNPTEKFVANVMKLFHEYDNAIRSERIKEGIRKAKVAGEKVYREKLS